MSLLGPSSCFCNSFFLWYLSIRSCFIFSLPIFDLLSFHWIWFLFVLVHFPLTYRYNFLSIFWKVLFNLYSFNLSLFLVSLLSQISFDLSLQVVFLVLVFSFQHIFMCFPFLALSLFVVVFNHFFSNFPFRFYILVQLPLGNTDFNAPVWISSFLMLPAGILVNNLVTFSVSILTFFSFAP